MTLDLFKASQTATFLQVGKGRVEVDNCWFAHHLSEGGGGGLDNHILEYPPQPKSF